MRGIHESVLGRLAPVGVLAVLLAGCADKASVNDQGPAESDPAPRVRLDPPSSLDFLDPLLLGQVVLGAEPSIETGADGWTYVTTPLALWRSSDGGSTYEQLGTPACVFGLPACPLLEEKDPGMKGGGDADVTVTPDGALHWLGLADGDNAIPYQVSTDRGETWSEVEDLAGDDGADREWITNRADGTMFAAWRHFGQSESHIVTRTSFDGGQSWTPISNVAEDTRQGGVSVDPSSNLIALPYDVAGQIMVARSLDNGTTWDSVEVSDAGPRGHIFPVTAIDGNGTIYLVWAQDPRGNMLGAQGRDWEVPSVYLSVSKDHGSTWAAPLQLNPPGTTAVMPWIAAGAAGRVIVAWYQSPQGLPLVVGGTWHVVAAVSLDADYLEPRFATRQVTTEPVHVGAICTNGGACGLEFDRSFLDFFQVAIHPDGHAVLAWTQDADARRLTVNVAASRLVNGPNLLGDEAS